MTSNHRQLDEADISLIQRVRLMPTLYDPRNPDFRLAYRKEQDWDTVAQCLGIPATDARRRWTCLRDRYSRELKQLRLHPESGEYGKNEFFRQMDFLRRFVRKRRERRRTIQKYDGSWDESMDESRMVASVRFLDHDDEKDDDDEQIVQNLTEEQDTYNGELETETETKGTYPQFVEVDVNETYESYVEPQPTEISDTATDAKLVTSSVLPIIVSQSNGSPYTLTTQLCNTSASLKQHDALQQQQQQQQQHQSQYLSQSHSPMDTPIENEDDFFCKSVAVYLRQLSRRHKIKAKVEMFQILEKYIEIEETSTMNCTSERP